MAASFNDVFSLNSVLLIIFCFQLFISCSLSSDPIVINTWPFTDATYAAWAELQKSDSAMNAVQAGCSKCESLQCDGTVGYGGSPDENGETTLDAMIMNGDTFEVGSVAALRNVKNAIAVARAVSLYSKHTLLVGDQATEFAKEMGFKITDLHTQHSKTLWQNWKNNSCQPNSRKNVHPDPATHCGPYKPNTPVLQSKINTGGYSTISNTNHDTIGMVALNSNGSLAAGTSTNGLKFKVPGRVGDSPIIGAGAFADSKVGGAAATGDGDIMMRFLPSFLAVERMRLGDTPTEACEEAIRRITPYYPQFTGAVIALSKTGNYGAACHGLSDGFHYSIVSKGLKNVTVLAVECTS